ncbi:uncharacterized protein LOC115634310 [Scaptodrosophila lebanonensis]|uniref:Uncharacterized protein LOC115634310 n=1 Tax=Drosophila lebanonensis TaxID=7225 RepID=A0A6J2UK15_DROLE|nr:uncharacterized protein LOC115634310 [Scaptodrosophila lebanonensis]
MSLVADYSDSSDSETSNESEAEVIGNAPLAKNQKALPSANTVLANVGCKKAGEVFSNPFLEAELNQTASLERHVKMVNSDTHLQLKNGKKICWNYRKGRCRFGTSCQYAHDSDLSTTETATNEASLDVSKSILTASPTTTATSGSVVLSKRKRPGLSDGIEPSKRVMKSYQQHSK